MTQINVQIKEDYAKDSGCITYFVGDAQHSVFFRELNPTSIGAVAPWRRVEFKIDGRDFVAQMRALLDQLEQDLNVLEPAKPETPLTLNEFSDTILVTLIKQIKAGAYDNVLWDDAVEGASSPVMEAIQARRKIVQTARALQWTPAEVSFVNTLDRYGDNMLGP